MRTTATFRMAGGAAPARTAARVTERLGIEPTGAHEAGPASSGRYRAPPRESSLWLLRSSHTIESGVELGTQLERLLETLEPVTGQLWALVDEGYWANWFCYVGSHATEHAAELERPLLRRLLVLPGDLWIDVDGDDDGEDEPVEHVM